MFIVSFIKSLWVYPCWCLPLFKTECWVDAVHAQTYFRSGITLQGRIKIEVRRTGKPPLYFYNFTAPHLLHHFHSVIMLVVTNMWHSQSYLLLLQESRVQIRAESFQWLATWYSMGYRVRCLVWSVQCWDWVARCQYLQLNLHHCVAAHKMI